uniref:Uncharacterized protein n=1 Tax=Trypanosoma congolense (strain IL3000) TaxID=1068625 RepID=G0UWA4_TRYCI|nr:conserved hypothetical protein [Trypanosoma congolense IL3000]
MCDLSHRFSHFIDHYILLLAERFSAPLNTSTLPADNDNVTDVHFERWEHVAQSLQEVLRHPKTDDERRSLLHIDLNHFDAKVCRGRALYLLWRAEKGRVVNGKAPVGGKHSAHSYSRFDITRDSLRDEIHDIYSSVRARLPDTFVPRGGYRSKQSNSAAFVNSKDEINPMDTESDSSEGSLHVVDIVLPSEAEVNRERVVAEARDALLKKVQEMQADFFDKHRRWIDVPFDLDPIPVGKKTFSDSSATRQTALPVTDTDAMPKSAACEALEKRTGTQPAPVNEDLVGLPREGSAEASRGGGTEPLFSLLDALRRAHRVDRPLRPSQMQEDDYKKQYEGASSIAQPSIHSLTGFVGGAPPGPIKDPPAEPSHSSQLKGQRKQCLHNVSGKPDDGNTGVTGSGGSVSDPVAPPVRANRWNVVEYGGESDSESEDSEGASEEEES